MRGSKAQRIRAINCQLGKADAGCLTNFCAAVNACIDSGNFGNTFSTGLTNVAGTVTADISTGKAGGQTIYGGVAASESLTISSTAHATKGFIYVGTCGAFDGANNRLGLVSLVPTHTLTLGSTSTGAALYNTIDQTTNYERMNIDRSANIARIGFNGGGSASSRQMRMYATNGTGGSASNFTIQRGGTPYFVFDIATALTNTSGSCISLLTTGTSLASSSGTVSFVSIAPSVNQTSTAGYTGLLINITETATGSGTKYLFDGQVGGVSKFSVTNKGRTIQDATMTAGGTTGVQTIDKPTGSVNLAAGESSKVVNNSLVNTSSIITCVIMTNDTTAILKNCVPGSGTFTINTTAAVTAETKIGFIVHN